MNNRRRLLIGAAQSGGGGGGGLPEGYTQLNYIQSTGEQWIDTGLKPGVYGGMGFQFLNFSIVDSDYSWWNCFFGVADEGGMGNGGLSWGFDYEPGDTYLAIAQGSLDYGDTVNGGGYIPLGTEYVQNIEAGFNSDGGYSKINGQIQNIVTQSALYSPNYNVYLFGKNQALDTSVIFASRIKFSRAKVTTAPVNEGNLDGTTLLRDYVPALDPNGTPCLYDLISEQPFYNINENASEDFSYG